METITIKPASGTGRLTLRVLQEQVGGVFVVESDEELEHGLEQGEVFTLSPCGVLDYASPVLPGKWRKA